MSVFEQRPPTQARIRVDAAGAPPVDLIVPAMLALYPDPTNATKVAFRCVVQNEEQLAELIASAIRVGTARGVMQMVLASLTSTPLNIQHTQYGPPPKDTPLDDLPPHDRPPRPPRPTG